MDASEAGRILPNPRQRGRAGSGQSSEVNSAEKEESIQGQRNVFEEVPPLFSGPPTTTTGVYSCAGVGEMVTTQASTDVDFAMQFLNLPSSDSLFTSVVPTSEVMTTRILDESSTYIDHHYASDSEESDSAQTATDEIAPCQSLFTSNSSGSKDSCKMQLDSTNIIRPGMQSDIDEDPSRQLQERRKEKKRYIDRERKRYLRKTDKDYLEADREKAKLRMRMKRQDPQYRQREKDRNREQKRKSRAELKRKEQDSAVQLKVPAEMEADDILEHGSDVINRFPAAHCFMEKITSPLEMLTESLVTLPPSLDLEDIHSFQDYSLFPYSADTHPSLEPSFALDSNDST